MKRILHKRDQGTAMSGRQYCWVRLTAGGVMLLLTAARLDLCWARPPQEPRPVGQNDVRRLSAQGVESLRKQDFPAAIATYQKLVRLAPRVAEFHSNLCLAYYSVHRYLEAVPECREARKLNPSLTAPRLFLDLSLAESHQCKQVLPELFETFQKVTDPGMKRQLGLDGARCAMATGAPDVAVRFAQELMRLFPGDPDVLYRVSHVYSDLSTQASERLLRSAPGSWQALEFDAEVLELQGKLGDAAADYQKILDFNPDLPEIHYRLGLIRLAQAGKDSAALEKGRQEFEAELKVNPENSQAEYELGQIAWESREWQEAIQCFRRAAQFDPYSAPALAGLGKSLIAAGQVEQALQPLEAVAKLDPGDPDVLYQLAFAYRRLGRNQAAAKALVEYQKARQQVQRTMEKMRTGMQGSPKGESDLPPRR